MVSLGDRANLSNHQITRAYVTQHIQAPFPIQLTRWQCIDEVLEQARPAGEQADCIDKNEGLHNLHKSHECDGVISLQWFSMLHKGRYSLNHAQRHINPRVGKRPPCHLRGTTISL